MHVCTRTRTPPWALRDEAQELDDGDVHGDGRDAERERVVHVGDVHGDGVGRPEGAHVVREEKPYLRMRMHMHMHMHARGPRREAVPAYAYAYAYACMHVVLEEKPYLRMHAHACMRERRRHTQVIHT